jgi:hypothetical protein
MYANQPKKADSGMPTSAWRQSPQMPSLLHAGALAAIVARQQASLQAAGPYLIMHATAVSKSCLAAPASRATRGGSLVNALAWSSGEPVAGGSKPLA